MDPIRALQTATNVISLLEFCWSLAAGDCAVDKLTITSEATKVKDSLTVFQVLEQLRTLSSVRADTPGESKHEQDLATLVLKCSAQANVLLRLLESQSPSAGEIAAEWQSFQLAWKASRDTTEVAHVGLHVAQHGAELGTWLIESLSDDKWAVTAYLKNLQKEADSADSVRAREVVLLKKDILSALGHHSNDESSTAKEARRRERPKGAMNSSDSSGNESRQIRKPKPKKRVRHTKGQQASRASVAGSTAVELPVWVIQVKKLLATLCHWATVVPVEICVLKHLVYESIDSREDSIREAESGTFSWMLDGTSTDGLQPHMADARKSFIQWLNSGSGVFHISGNAGSGKSTLMKFLRHHNRTQFELSEWAGERRLVFSSFYFWNSGSEMQMSLEGLYRSLLLEVSRKCPDLIPALFPDQWEAVSSLSNGVTIEGGFFGPKEIDDAFNRLLAIDASQKYRMCFFIDGLDEYTGDNVDYGALARSLLEWGEKDGVKLCVSARPYGDFLNTFDPSLRLHLHELTSQDIKKFATDSFERTNGLNFGNEETLISGIVRKSEGVFLWARVVIRSLVSLAKRGVDEVKLLQRLETYPTNIDQLYDCMLESLEPDERVRSNQMLLLASRNPFAQALNALCFSWIDGLDNPEFPRINRPYSTAAIADRHANIRLDLEHLTKGLLEMHTDRRERKDGDQFYRQRIQFFHRTARDYLRSPARLDQMQYSFGSSSLPAIFSRLRLAEIVLAGKYRVAKGADPRRRRMYFNYVRTLFGLRDEQGHRYQIPRRYMHALKEDLESTRSDKFSSSYAVSSYVSISNYDVIDEDPEKSASFLHFALSHGQHQYVVEELRDDADLIPEKPATFLHFAQAHGQHQFGTERPPEKTSLRPTIDELDFRMSAAFGNRRLPLGEFGTLLTHATSPLSKIRIRPSLGTDFLTAKSYRFSVLTVFVSTLVFACIGESRSRPERRGHSSDRKNVKDLFIILGHLLEATMTKHLSGNSVPANTSNEAVYLCLLHETESTNEEDTSHKILYTTLGQLALRYAPTEAERLLPLLGESNVLDAEYMDVDGSVSGSRLPSWAVDSVPEVGPSEYAVFVAHDRIDGHFCSKVKSANESIAAEDNLFFRIY